MIQQEKQWDVIILGGGAAGLTCAVQAACRGCGVLVLERLDRVGKKLLATGNGRCNLMNTGEPRYPRGGDFAERVLAACGAEDQLAFWESLGLRLREEEDGRVYPASGAATTVLDVLRLALERCGVTVETGCEVTAAERTERGFRVRCGGRCFEGRRLVIAGGGCAQEKLGSNGTAAALLRSLGHRCTGLTPALTAFSCDTKPIAGLSGIRVRATVSVMTERGCLHSEPGEVLFTDYGLSGVCVMNCSCYWQPGAWVSLNLLRAFGLRSRGELQDELTSRCDCWPDEPCGRLLTGLCVPRLADCVLKAADIRKEMPAGRLTGAALRRLAETAEDFRVPVQSLRGFEQAQVTAGGIRTEEFDPATMASGLVPGLYACGEVLDVNGECGGYNLMFAVAGGLLAGDAVADDVTGKGFCR